MVDWDLFDIVGIDYYPYFRHRTDYVRELRKYLRWRKPAVAYNFVTPDAPHRRQRRYALDLASYSIVETGWESRERPGSHWHWEPKEAFHALARAYGRCR